MSYSVTVKVKDGKAEVIAAGIPTGMDATVTVSGHIDAKWSTHSIQYRDDSIASD